MDSYAREEHLACLIARLLDGARHAAVGASSPIPAVGCFLKKNIDPAFRVSLQQRRESNPFTEGSRELFDLAGQGRIDVFFLGGAQIDGAANINLVTAEGRRFPGSFGSAFMYPVVPRVILFREEHSRRSLVPRVDFVSAPGVSQDNVYRPGGPYALVTNRCVFAFDKTRRRFRLASVHPGHTTDEIRANTGFDYDYEAPAEVPPTPAPDPESLALIRGRIGAEIGEVYPRFARRLAGVAG